MRIIMLPTELFNQWLLQQCRRTTNLHTLDHDLIEYQPPMVIETARPEFGWGVRITFQDIGRGVGIKW